MSHLQPPSPSLSPNSTIRHYQQQLDLAHQLIDHLENVLAEKEEQKYKFQFNNDVFIPRLDLNSKSPTISERSRSYVATPQQYSTPRDARTRVSMGSNIKYIEEMKVRHSALLNQSVEERQTKEQKNKEITENIQELKTELTFSQEKLAVTKKQKQNTKEEYDRVMQEIERVQHEIAKSKEQGKQLEDKLLELKNTNQNIQEEIEISDCDQHTPIIEFKLSFRQSTSQKKQIDSLKEEILMLETQKFELLQSKQGQDKQIEVNEHSEPLIQKNDPLRVDTLDDVRIITDSGFKLNTNLDECENEESVKSFTVRRQKRRDCESCKCF